MDVGLALRNTSKGRIKYDKYWAQEGRTKEMLDEISKKTSNLTLGLSAKILDLILSENQDGNKSCDNDEKKDIPDSSPKENKPKKESENINSDIYFYEKQYETERPILEYEEATLQFMEDTFNSKRKEFDDYSNELQQLSYQEYLLIKRKNELDAKRRAAELDKAEKEILEEARKKQQALQERSRSHVKILSEKVQEAEMRRKKAEEERKKIEQEKAEMKALLYKCHEEAQENFTKSIKKLASFEYSDHLQSSQKEQVDKMTKVLQKIAGYVEQAEHKDVTIDDILNANLCVKEVLDVYQEIVNDIENAKFKALKSHEKSPGADIVDLSSSPLKEQGNSDTISPEINKGESESEVMSEDVTDISKIDKERELLSRFIAPDTIDEHLNVMENLKCIESNFVEPFKKDPRNKKIRFELQKAINVPINSLSSNSGSQIKIKINRLLTILSGNMPEISMKNMSSDSAIYNFSTYLIAKQFVEQGDTQISAQHSTAFPIAMAILGIWSKKPDVGSLILGHFYSRCPYLVPFYPPKQVGQSDVEYYTMLGYHVDDQGVIEEKHKFLNRISGYVRLYAAIICAPLPPSVKAQHPHGLVCGWKWLARIINLEPRPDITATVLFDFLDVAGHSLQKIYGKQFKKIIYILCKEFFPKIKQVTPGGTGGPIERLETFLQQTAKKGYISPPNGFLDSNFWNR